MQSLHVLCIVCAFVCLLSSLLSSTFVHLSSLEFFLPDFVSNNFFYKETILFILQKEHGCDIYV